MATTAKKSTKTKTTKTAKTTPKTTKTVKATKSAPKTVKAPANKPAAKPAAKSAPKTDKKTGKKCLIAIIVVAIIAVVAAAGFCVYNKFFAFPNISGTYELTGMEADGEDQSGSLNVLKGLGLEATLELKEDKTGKLNLFGDESDVTYDRENIVINDDEAGYSYKDGTITLEEDGTKLIFTLKK